MNNQRLQMTQTTTSTPKLTEFKPLPAQFQLIRDIRRNFSYENGVAECLLSGSVGSSKSLAMAHIGLTHCMMNPGACLGLGRLSMPALKGTIFNTILEHIPDGLHVNVNTSQAIIQFPNGSIIRSFSWQDKKYKKVRSFEFSSFLIEELTENDTDDAYTEIYLRTGRLQHVKEKFLLCATNPDSPGHWAYKHFISEPKSNRYVYYSKTEDNPFLPRSYVESLKENLDPKMARRMLYGEWIDINQERVYHAYDKARDFTTTAYRIDKSRPIFWSHDFNIGEGKPMSSILFQVSSDGTFHFFAEIVIDGARTSDVCDELAARGILWSGARLIIMGDSTGRSRDTRSIHSDYDILKTWATNHSLNLQVEIFVPRANPPIRTRHNLVNAQCLNSLGQSRFMIHNLKVADEGMRLTKLKPGGNYIEDDSFRAQHICTGIGYGIYAFKNLYSEDKQTSGSYER